jgi:hypothetical protein
MFMGWFGHKLMCKDVTRLLSQAQDSRLPFLARIRVRAHLKVCALCTRFEAQLAFLREAARRYKA